MKNIKSLLVILFLLVFIFLIVGCNNDQKLDNKDTDEEVEIILEFSSPSDRVLYIDEEMELIVNITPSDKDYKYEITIDNPKILELNGLIVKGVSVGPTKVTCKIEDKDISKTLDFYVLEEIELSDELANEFIEVENEMAGYRYSDGYLRILDYFGAYGENKNLHILWMNSFLYTYTYVGIWSPFFELPHFVYKLDETGKSDVRYYLFFKKPNMPTIVPALIDLADRKRYFLQDALDNNLITIDDLDIAYMYYIKTSGDYIRTCEYSDYIKTIVINGDFFK